MASLLSSLSSGGLGMLQSLAQQQGLQDQFFSALRQQFPVDPNSQCGKDMAEWGTALRNGEYWALQSEYNGREREGGGRE